MEPFTIRVLGGISQEAVSYATAPGSWETLINAELSFDGALSKRPGLEVAYAPTSVPTATLHARGGAVLAQGPAGQEILWSEGANGNQRPRSDYRREWQASARAEDTLASQLTCSAARVGQWLVVSYGGRVVEVIDTTTNTAIPALTITEGYDLFAGADRVLALRTSGSATLRRVLDATGPVPVWGAETATGAFVYRVCAVPGVGWAVVASTGLGNDLLLLNHTGAITATLPITAAGPVTATATTIYVASSPTAVDTYSVSPLAYTGSVPLVGVGGDQPLSVVERAGQVIVLLTDTSKRHSFLRGTVSDYGSALWARPVSEVARHGGGVSWWVALGASTALDSNTDPSAASYALLYAPAPLISVIGCAAYGEMPLAAPAAFVMSHVLWQHAPDDQQLSVLARTGPTGPIAYVLRHTPQEQQRIARGAEHADGHLLTGGLAMRWSGTEDPESAGYLAAPVIQQALAEPGGSLSPGVYRYQAIYERYHAGRWVRSAASPPAVVTLVSGITDAVSLTVRVIAATDVYEDTRISIYRSTVNAPLGAPLYLVIRQTQSTATAGLVGYFDVIPDSLLSSREILYTTDGHLDADPIPGGARFVHTHRDRVYAVGMERDDVVWVSQPHQSGVATEFSLGLLLELPGERLLGLATLDDALVIFGRERAWLAFGQGPAPSGDPQTGGWEVIPLDVPPLADPRSVVQTPIGVMYLSSRGFELLDQSRSAQPIGRAVQREIQPTEPVLASAYLQHRSEVHWLMPSGRVVLNLARASATVDPRRGVDAGPLRWSLWNHNRAVVDGGDVPLTLTGIVYAGGRRVVCHASSGWYRETDSYSDPGGAWYGLVVRTPDLSLPATQMRLRRIDTTVTLRGRSGLRVTIAEGNNVVSDEHEWTPDDVIAQSDGGGSATLIAPAAAPLYDSVRVALYETRGDADSAGLSLLALDLWLLRRGARKRAGGDYR